MEKNDLLSVKENEINKMAKLSLRPWQQQVYDMGYGAHDSERIIWIYDNEGNAGKTRFVQHIHNLQNADFDRHNELWKQCPVVIELDRSVRGLNGEHFEQQHAPIVGIQDGMGDIRKYNDLSAIKERPMFQQVIVLASFLPDVQHINPDKVHVFMCDATNLYEMCYHTNFQVIGG